MFQPSADGASPSFGASPSGTGIGSGSGGGGESDCESNSI